MSLKLPTLLLATSLLLSACQSGNSMHMDHSASSAPAEPIPADAIDLHNTICPVTGDKVGDSKFWVLYQGKVYHTCCSDCPTDFKKDPAKYAKLVADNPAKYGVK